MAPDPAPRSPRSTPTATGGSTSPRWTSSPATTTSTTAGIDYTMTSIEPDLEARALAASTTTDDDVTDEVLDLPPGVPTLVRELALAVTEEAPTKFEKAVALQTWFREEGGFEYDLRAAPVGNGVNTLEAFLDGQRGRPGRLLRAVRLGDGRDGPGPRHPGPGGGRVPRPQTGRRRRLRVQHPRPARLARALLRGRRLGALRADPQRPGRDACRTTPTRASTSATPPPARRAPPPAPSRPSPVRPTAS